MNSTVAEPRDTGPSRPSILAHPWFAKVIALWFAALFGLCSLAVAPELLERVVTTLGIDRILPAAAPPLGQTARLLLAMGMAGVGEIVGLVIGGRLAAGRGAQSRTPRQVEPAERDDNGSDTGFQVRDRDRHADAPPRKPLAAADDLEARPSREDATEPAAEPAPAMDAVEGLHQAVPAAFAAPAPALPAAAAISAASLDSLGVVQLSERLALALQTRRERRAPQTLPASEPGPEPRLDSLARGGRKPVLAGAICTGETTVDGATLPESDPGEANDLDEMADETAERDYPSLLAMGSGGRRAAAE